MPKKYILILLMGLCANILCAQLPVYTCDFEDPNENTQWVLNPNMTKLQLENNWFIGESGDFSVDHYEVPNKGQNDDYYIFSRFASDADPVTLPAGKVTTMPPFYLLEGKYADPDKVVDADGNLLNYSMSATLNGITYESYFPDVPWLPRNTHVVTVVTIKNHGVNWTVDVYPYGEYWLNPGFGI